MSNNADGQYIDSFDWDGFLDEDTVGGAYCGNHSPMPSDEGVCNIQASKDYDDVCNGDDGSDGNVGNRNDDESDGNVQNGNDEEALNNASTGDDVQGALQGQDNNVPREPEDVPIQDRVEFNNPQQLNENFNQGTTSQYKAVVETKMICPYTSRKMRPV